MRKYCCCDEIEFASLDTLSCALLSELRLVSSACANRDSRDVDSIPLHDLNIFSWLHHTLMISLCSIVYVHYDHFDNRDNAET